MRPIIMLSLAALLGVPAGGTAEARDGRGKAQTETRKAPRQDSRQWTQSWQAEPRSDYSSSYAGSPSSYRIGRSDRDTKAFFDHISSYGE